MRWHVWMVLAVLVGCDHADEQATDHLRATGFKTVACAHNGYHAAVCIADETRFNCVVSQDSGCNTSAAVACERFFVEKPAP